MVDKTFIELYEELSKLYESEELTEKDDLKKAAVAAGLLAGGIGAGAGINQVVNNYSNTRETPISAPAQTTNNEDNYLSYNDTDNGKVAYEDWANNLNISATLVDIIVHYQVQTVTPYTYPKETISNSETRFDTNGGHDGSNIIFTKDKITINSANFSKLHHFNTHLADQNSETKEVSWKYVDIDEQQITKIRLTW